LWLIPTCSTSWTGQVLFSGNEVLSSFHFKRGPVGGSPTWLLDRLILSQFSDERPSPGLAPPKVQLRHGEHWSHDIFYVHQLRLADTVPRADPRGGHPPKQWSSALMLHFQWSIGNRAISHFVLLNAFKNIREHFYNVWNKNKINISLIIINSFL